MGNSTPQLRWQHSSYGESLVAPLLVEFLHSQGAMAASEVARRIDGLYLDKRGKPCADREMLASGEGLIHATWDNILDVAASVPHDHPWMERLVDVVRELPKLPSRPVMICRNDVRRTPISARRRSQG